jgi:hypothetical protein
MGKEKITTETLLPEDSTSSPLYTLAEPPYAELSSIEAVVRSVRSYRDRQTIRLK